MALLGRRREIAMVQGLLDRAGEGSGGVLVLAGPEGSGRTALASLAAGTARRRGFDVHRAAAVAGRPGRWAWAQLLRDAGAPERIISGLLADPGPLDLDSAAAALSGGQRRRLLVVDHVDRGGGQAIEMLSALAGCAVTGPTAVLVTSAVPLGVGQELWLRALTPAEIGAVTGGAPPPGTPRTVGGVARQARSGQVAVRRAGRDAAGWRSGGAACAARRVGRGLP